MSLTVRYGANHFGHWRLESGLGIFGNYLFPETFFMAVDNPFTIFRGDGFRTKKKSGCRIHRGATMLPSMRMPKTEMENHRFVCFLDM